MKKIIILAIFSIALCTSTFVLAGCGSDNSQPVAALTDDPMPLVGYWYLVLDGEIRTDEIIRYNADGTNLSFLVDVAGEVITREARWEGEWQDDIFVYRFAVTSMPGGRLLIDAYSSESQSVMWQDLCEDDVKLYQAALRTSRENGTHQELDNGRGAIDGSVEQFEDLQGNTIFVQYINDAVNDPDIVEWITLYVIFDGNRVRFYGSEDDARADRADEDMWTELVRAEN